MPRWTHDTSTETLAFQLARRPATARLGTGPVGLEASGHRAGARRRVRRHRPVTQAPPYRRGRRARLLFTAWPNAAPHARAARPAAYPAGTKAHLPMAFKARSGRGAALGWCSDGTSASLIIRRIVSVPQALRAEPAAARNVSYDGCIEQAGYGIRVISLVSIRNR